MSTYATSERTRQALIEAAGELFARHGVDAVGTRAIAEKAGENIGSIHYHFGGKEGLLLATARFVTTVWQDRPVERWIAERARLHGTREGQSQLIAGLVHIYFQRLFFADMPWWACQLFHQTLTFEGPAANLLIETIVRPHLDQLMACCAQLRPEFSLVERRVWAISFVSQITHYALVQPALCKVFEMERYTDEFIEAARCRVIENSVRGLGLPMAPELLEKERFVTLGASKERGI